MPSARCEPHAAPACAERAHAHHVWVDGPGEAARGLRRALGGRSWKIRGRSRLIRCAGAILSDEGQPKEAGIDPEQGDSDGSPRFSAGRSLRPDREPLFTLVQPSVRSGEVSAAPVPRYEILEEIGRGGMGVVFRALQIDLGREVAIKRVKGAHPEVRAKFVAESRISGRLDHPGIVPVHDLILTQEDAALVMKLVRGTSWKALLRPARESDRRDLDFHLGVLMSVSNAVAFAHSKGLAHCDLKPANVMVGEFGEVLVADWGLALDISDDEPHRSAAPHRSMLDAPSGTPAYWAPELARGDGKSVGPWTDVYLLGSILHEIATGAPPHRARSVRAAIVAALRSRTPRFGPDVPAGLQDLCARAMARSPADRFPTVAAFQQALRAFLSHRESLTISRAASATLERAIAEAEATSAEALDNAQRVRIYSDFGEAATGFRQARVLWPESAEAAQGERRASMAAAKLALENGDLGFADVHVARLDPAAPDVAALIARIERAKVERQRAARTARRLRRGLAAAVGAVVVSLSVGLLATFLEHRRSEAARALATSRLADIRRLADVKQLADYTAEADALWPALPERVDAMQAWLVKARTLADHRDGNRAYLEHLRRNAVERAPAFRFATAAEQWEHDTLAALVEGLEAFTARTIPDVERRVEFARQVRRKTLEEPRAAWERALASIADPGECPAYGGLKLAPQLGLVPLGRDPASGLWEFAHLASGEVPARGADGRLRPTEATGVVLVLLPGGTFRMGTMPPDKEHLEGSPNVDASARSPERPAHAVTLAPFFMGKHELTQGQWLRVAGVNPSAYPGGTELGGRRHTLLHPVEQISWRDASRMLARLGLQLSTEAQWEYAARGGTTSVYWSGQEKASLQGAANLADRYCKEHGGPGSWQFEMWLDDGYVTHAPVGTYRANGFGLHDVAGNVWEFVQDHYGSYELPVRPGDGERQVPGDTPRVFRGGGFRSNAVHARSGDRYSLYAPDFVGFDVGVRAARAVE
jgi:formylglycine-generating enzyme required for sulfatase activity/serine/threonine protein kinase